MIKRRRKGAAQDGQDISEALRLALGDRDNPDEFTRRAQLVADGEIDPLAMDGWGIMDFTDPPIDFGHPDGAYSPGHVDFDPVVRAEWETYRKWRHQRSEALLNYVLARRGRGEDVIDILMDRVTNRRQNDG